LYLDLIPNVNHTSNESFPSKECGSLLTTTDFLEINTNNYLQSDIIEGSNLYYIDVFIFWFVIIYIFFLSLSQPSVLMLTNYWKKK